MQNHIIINNYDFLKKLAKAHLLVPAVNATAYLVFYKTISDSTHLRIQWGQIETFTCHLFIIVDCYQFWPNERTPKCVRHET